MLPDKHAPAEAGENLSIRAQREEAKENASQEGAEEKRQRGVRKFFASALTVMVTLGQILGVGGFVASTAGAQSTAGIVTGVIGIVIVGSVVADENVTADLNPLTVLIVGFITVAMGAGLVWDAFRRNKSD